MQTQKRPNPLSANKILIQLVAAALLTSFTAWAQSPGQPPVEACKPGNFTVIGYPDEFGPVAAGSYRVRVDNGFNGEFQTTKDIWLPVIESALSQWSGVSGSDWTFHYEGTTGDDPNPDDGVLNILPCGVLFTCPSEPPPTDPGGPGLPPGTVLTNENAFNTALAVTFIFEDKSTSKGVRDAIIEFNPLLPFSVTPHRPTSSSSKR